MALTWHASPNRNAFASFKIDDVMLKQERHKEQDDIDNDNGKNISDEDDVENVYLHDINVRNDDLMMRMRITT